MKTLAVVLVIIFYSGLGGLAQNRIHGWDVDKITSIRVELTSTDDEKEVHIFSSKPDMDRIFSFLRDVDFKEFVANDNDAKKETNFWIATLSFQGQRDMVYLNKHSACIGKTSFVVDSDVIEGFRTMLDELVSKLL